MATLSLEQFRRTRAYCADLCKHPTVGPNMADLELEAPVPGYVYLDCLWIEINCHNETDTTPAELRGAFHLVIANSEWLVDDLALLERHLYDFAVGEDYCQAPVRDPGRFADVPDDVLDTALNAALVVVQNYLGQTDGGPASVYFQGEPRAWFYAVLEAYAGYEARYNNDDLIPVTIETLQQWAKFAVPTSDDDWGSKRQIAAENFFFESVQGFGVDTTRWETSKASVEEMVAEALEASRKHAAEVV